MAGSEAIGNRLCESPGAHDTVGVETGLFLVVARTLGGRYAEDAIHLATQHALAHQEVLPIGYVGAGQQRCFQFKNSHRFALVKNILCGADPLGPRGSPRTRSPPRISASSNPEQAGEGVGRRPGFCPTNLGLPSCPTNWRYR